MIFDGEAKISTGKQEKNGEEGFNFKIREEANLLNVSSFNLGGTMFQRGFYWEMCCRMHFG